METIVAIDVGGTKTAGALVSYAGHDEPPMVSSRRCIATEPERGGEAVLESTVRLAGDLMEACADAPSGIGVGAAGVVNPADGSILYANEIMPGWSGQPLGASLEARFGLPVSILGDAQAHALGEVRWGAARGASSCLVVAAGTGIGGAFALGNEVVRGFHGASAHLGQTCACSGEGDIESIASGQAIAACYGNGMLACEQVAERANAGDLDALSVLERAGRALGEAIAGWCNILDPELVVLSGGVARSGPFWRSALEEGFKARVIAPLADTPVLHAALGQDAPIIGAAEQVLLRKGRR